MKTLSVVLLCVSACLLGDLHAAEAPKTVTIPFEILKTKHIAIRIRINGKGPYRVIFDTGAPVSIINTRTARASGMVNRAAAAPMFSLFGSMGPTKIKSLQVGDVTVKDTSAVVMDHPTVELLSRFLGPIEGIVGYPFWSRFQVAIDYQTRRMTFTPNGYKPDDAMEAMMQSLMSAAEGGDKAPLLKPAAQWGVILHKDKGDDDAGVQVKKVLPGSAAADAGLRAGDRLLVLDGRWTDSVADAYRAAGFVKPGTAARVVIRRDGEEKEITVKPRAGL